MDTTTFGPPKAATPWARAFAIAIAGLIVWLFIRNMSAGWDFTTDDAFITLRYARNLVDGHGIVWNPGEIPPVEGYSNFSYVALGAGAMKLGLNPVELLKWLGVLGIGLGCVASWFIARTFVGAIAALIPALFIVSYRGTAYWAVSGLETGFYLGLTLACVACWARGLGFLSSDERGEIRAPWLWAAYLLAVLVTLTRPEGGLIVVVITLASLQRSWRDSLRLLWKPLAMFSLLVGAYFVWKLVHFGELMPNSAKCKAMFTGDGDALTRDYWSLAAPWVLVSLAYKWKDLGRRHLVLWLYPLAYAVLLTGVDPIIGQWNRHALTAWSMLVIVGCVGIVKIGDFALSSLRGFSGDSARASLLAAGAALWAFVVVPDPVVALEREATFYARRTAARAELGDWLETHVAPDEWVAIGDCGMIPYRTHAKVLDVFCLNSREVSMPPVSFDPERVAKLVAAMRPKAIVIHSREPKRQVPRHEYGVYGALVRRPELAADYRHATTIGAAGDDFHYWVYLRN